MELLQVGYFFVTYVSTFTITIFRLFLPDCGLPLGVDKAGVHATVDADPKDSTAAGVAPRGYSYPGRSPVSYRLIRPRDGRSPPYQAAARAMSFGVFASPIPLPYPHETPYLDPKEHQQQPAGTLGESLNPFKIISSTGTTEEEELSAVLGPAQGPEEDSVPSSEGTPGEILNPLKSLGVHPSQTLGQDSHAHPAGQVDSMTPTLVPATTVGTPHSRFELR